MRRKHKTHRQMKINLPCVIALTINPWFRPFSLIFHRKLPCWLTQLVYWLVGELSKQNFSIEVRRLHFSSQIYLKNDDFIFLLIIGFEFEPQRLFDEKISQEIQYNIRSNLKENLRESEDDSHKNIRQVKDNHHNKVSGVMVMVLQ